ncbi:hypothetical protein COCVIDRAFT_99092, partial [Bipolaris victoriae FI3]
VVMNENNHSPVDFDGMLGDQSISYYQKKYICHHFLPLLLCIEGRRHCHNVATQG